MSASHWRKEIIQEIKRAQAARATGNEGQARVCARRAAGIAIGEFLNRQNLPDPGPNALARLNYLADFPSTSPQNREICLHLTMRVDENFRLPIEVDLIAEARQLIHNLVGKVE